MELQDIHVMYKGLLDQERESSVDMQKQVCVYVCKFSYIFHGGVWARWRNNRAFHVP